MPDGSYSVSDIQDYFEFIIKKHETLKIRQFKFTQIKSKKNCFQNKNRLQIELLTTETMKLLESGKKDVHKDKDSENVPRLEPVEVVLVYCNLVKNDYQHTSKVLFTFLPKKQFGQFLIFHHIL